MDTRVETNIKAASALAKLGLKLTNGTSKADRLEARANLRRCINKLRDDGSAALQKHDYTLCDEISNDLNACASVIDRISNSLDLDERAREVWGEKTTSATSELRDNTGRRIGTLLSNSDLRDRNKIAAKLGAGKAPDMDDGEGTPTLGDFFRGVAGMRTSSSIRNSLSEGTAVDGGYAVPTILLPGILEALVPATRVLEAGAHIAHIEDQYGKSFTVAAMDTIPTAAWRAESGAVVESDPTFRSIVITPQSLSFQIKVSRELLQDAPGMEQALLKAITQAFGKELDRAALRGSGTAPEIKGLLNMANVNSLVLGTGDGLKPTDYSAFIQARRLIADANAPMPNTAIMSNRDDETFSLLADTRNQPLRRPPAIKDWNFLPTSQIPTNLTVGTSADCSEIYVGNFSQFTFYMREGIYILQAPQLYAATGEIGFFCHVRVDVAASYEQAFTVITGVSGT